MFIGCLYTQLYWRRTLVLVPKSHHRVTWHLDQSFLIVITCCKLVEGRSRNKICVYIAGKIWWWVGPMCKWVKVRGAEGAEGEIPFPNGYNRRKSPSAKEHIPFLASLIAAARWKPTRKRNTPLTPVRGWWLAEVTQYKIRDQLAQGNSLLTLQRSRWKRNTLHS